MPEDQFFKLIWNVYGGKCVIHSHSPAVTIHEEPPRSLNPSWEKMPETRYTLCNLCHEKVHNMSRQDAKFWLDFNRDRNFPEARKALLKLTSRG